MKEIRINHNDANLRLDNFIKKVFPNIRTSEIYKYVRNKRIKVNNKKTEFNYKLQQGDVIQLYINDELLVHDKKITKVSKKQFDVVFEDKNILVVNKQPGLVVHTDNEGETNTLINQVINYLINKNEFDPNKENSFVPSLVNRIDRNTAGLVLIAKNRQALEILNEKFKTHEVRKFYIAEVIGHIKPKSRTAKAFLTKAKNKNEVIISQKPLTNDSKEIITKYDVIEHLDYSTIIDIEIFKGRTHQIRAHFNYLGYPLVGERKYISGKNKIKTKQKYQALIAYKIIFEWKSNAGILSYLNHKEIKLSKKDIEKYFKLT